jgi:hypothetical protein
MVSLPRWLLPAAVLLHAPIAFWNLLSSPPSSGASAPCLAACGAASSELRASVSAPPSIPARQFGVVGAVQAGFSQLMARHDLHFPW